MAAYVLTELRMSRAILPVPSGSARHWELLEVYTTTYLGEAGTVNVGVRSGVLQQCILLITCTSSRPAHSQHAMLRLVLNKAAHAAV